MRYVPRLLESSIRRAAAGFPAVLLTGPRRAGKTVLLRRAFPRAKYVLLEDPDVLARLQEDPRAFVEGLRPPVILDEIQNAPELFRWVRTRIDLERRAHGRWLLTGSQEAGLMGGVSESMAGRVAVFHMLPLSVLETPRVTWLRGGFPEVIAQPALARRWYESYLRTYLERDVRAVTAIRDLATFRRFLSLVASRVGQVLNRTDLAAPLGVSVPTISQWLSVLEVSGQIVLVHPYFENFGKRLTKAPKLYWTDSGLACHLLGIASEAELVRSPYAGAVFEGFVATEILKAREGTGQRPGLWFFRDRRGLEIDFIVELGGGRLALVEAKASRTARAAAVEPLVRLAESIGWPRVEGYLVHRHDPGDLAGTALRPGVKAVGVRELLEAMRGRPG